MQVNAKVIDTSHFDNVETSGTDWTGFAKVYAAGYRGVINKVTQGRGMVDTSYARRRGPALTNGLLYGAYHYFTTEDPVQQANHFLASAQIDDKTLMALDHETRGATLANAQTFMETVKAQTGRYPWLYSGFLIKEQLGKSPDFADMITMRMWFDLKPTGQTAVTYIPNHPLNSYPTNRAHVFVPKYM